MLGHVLHRIYVSVLEAASCPRMGTLKAGEEGIPPGPFLLTSGPGDASLRPADLCQSLGPTGTIASSTVLARAWPPCPVLPFLWS